MTVADTDLARRLWHVLEPVHAVVYFAPEVRRGYSAAGLKGFWMGYFAGRAHPLGRPSPELVTATFFNFAPAMVARAIPDAWTFAGPGEVAQVRLAGVDAALRRLLGDRIDSQELAEAADLAADAVAGCGVEGRPLFAAHLSLDRPAPVHLGLWHAATLLREHRGDGHVVANVAHGLSGLAAHVTFAAAGGPDRATLQPNRGWSDDDWEGCVAQLGDRGLLVDGELTAEGVALRHAVETTTDELAAGPVRRLGPERTGRLFELLEPIAAAVADRGGVPFPNPMGVPPPR